MIAKAIRPAFGRAGRVGIIAYGVALCEIRLQIAYRCSIIYVLSKN